MCEWGGGEVVLEKREGEPKGDLLYVYSRSEPEQRATVRRSPSTSRTRFPASRPRYGKRASPFPLTSPRDTHKTKKKKKGRNRFGKAPKHTPPHLHLTRKGEGETKERSSPLRERSKQKNKKKKELEKGRSHLRSSLKNPKERRPILLNQQRMIMKEGKKEGGEGDILRGLERR